MTASPEDLAAAVVAALRVRRQTLATSESLTGGLIGGTLTTVPGASEVYLGGAIAYATAMKPVLSGVRAEVVARHGVISEAVVTAMASGIRELTGADWAVAVSGVAGPTAQDGHPPGEVWIGLAGPDGVSGRRADLAGDRAAVRALAVEAALADLLAALAAQSS